MPSIASIRKRDQRADTEHQAVEAAGGFGRRAPRAPRAAPCRRCTTVDPEGQHRRHQQHDRPTTAPLWKSCWPITSLNTSVASTLKLPPITLGMPKSVITRVKTTNAAQIRPYLAPGSVMVQELAAGAGAQRLGRLVEARVGQRQRGHQDHQRMREHGEHLAHHDAERAVDADAQPQQALSNALVAEPVDQRDRRQQRGRQERHQGDRPEQPLQRHAAARERVGEERRPAAP